MVEIRDEETPDCYLGYYGSYDLLIMPENFSVFFLFFSVFFLQIIWKNLSFRKDVEYC